MARFQVPSFSYWLAIGFGMGLFTVEAWFPSLIPFEYLGPFGTFLSYLTREHALLLKIGYAAAILAHAGEAAYVWTLCRAMKLGGSDTLNSVQRVQEKLVDDICLVHVGD
ncbi:hypothetical protein EMCRGX_G026102 [Ephydatia muelleri]